MFTGIVASQGLCFEVAQSDAGLDFWVELGDLRAAARVGDSIAVKGCCLTIEELSAVAALFHAGRETLDLTSLGKLADGEIVNLEAALKMGDPLGGHVLSGHVDACGEIVAIKAESSQTVMTFELPSGGQRRVLKKGSIAIDGVSLTITEVAQNQVSVALIPHTLKVTGFGRASIGDAVNIEFDQMGAWIQKGVEAALRDEMNRDTLLDQRVEALVSKALRDRGIN
ncbi:MAG: riboflavin synthase [Planctomycetota bacterium]